MGEALVKLIELLFTDPRLEPTLGRPHCLGNLILAAAVYSEIPQSVTHDGLATDHALLAAPLVRGLGALAMVIGAAEQAVLPCTSVQAQLSVLYSNGVEVIGEYKSGYAQRGYPVERVFVNFCDKPHVYPEVLSAIAQADILVMAPGSLYSSLIPIFQVPGLARAVRDNSRALKILVSNLWVQAGETDRSMGDTERKFHVSDLLRAYDRNIPGGTRGLFDQVLCLSLKDVPASVLQNYAVEGKVPIYLDRAKVSAQGFIPIECGIFARTALAEQGFIQHGPVHLAKVIKTLWAVFDYFGTSLAISEQDLASDQALKEESVWDSMKRAVRPSSRYQQIEERLVSLSIENGGCRPTQGLIDTIRRMVRDILWRHPDIPLAHLQFVRGLVCVEQDLWLRNQKWDSVFSFYDPDDGLIKIRQDQFKQEQTFEVAFLVAIGQSLLGNYAHSKEMKPLQVDGVCLGKVYHLYLQPEDVRSCWFSDQELRRYLELARMRPTGMDAPVAFYLDNRFASHVEYKMAVMKIAPANLIPEQVKMLCRRQRLVSFFREVVFRKDAVR